MAYNLSNRSKNRLKGVRAPLVRVVERAIEITKVDFAVIEGVRTRARQRQLVKQGKSQTMNSKHISGRAVDLAAYVDGKISWDLKYYDEIADAMKQAAKELGVPLRWGAAWNVSDIKEWNGSAKSAMDHYVKTRRKAGRRPFIDAVHFELA